MTRILATVLVALLVVSAPVTAVVGSGGSPDAPRSIGETTLNEPDDISWITTGVDARAETATQGSDLGSALAMGDTAFRSEIDLRTVERDFEAAESPDEAQAVLEAQRDRIRERTIDLHEREAGLAAAYDDGEIDRAELLRGITQISEEATTLRSAAETVEELSGTDPQVSVSVRNIRGELTRFDSPIRGELRAATDGDAARTGPIQLSAAEETLVLSTLRSDGTYVREGVQFDRFAPEQPSNFESLTELDDRGPELYPWIYANLFEFGISGYDWLIGLSLDHPRGESMSYIDVTTQNVVAEYHTLDVETLSTTATVSRTNEAATISSSRVVDGGPVRVSVTAPDSEQPVPATVSVAGQEPVETGEDGSAWVLAPEGDVEVTATTDAGQVSVTVREPNG